MSKPNKDVTQKCQANKRCEATYKRCLRILMANKDTTY